LDCAFASVSPCAGDVKKKKNEKKENEEGGEKSDIEEIDLSETGHEQQTYYPSESEEKSIDGCEKDAKQREERTYNHIHE